MIFLMYTRKIGACFTGIGASPADLVFAGPLFRRFNINIFKNCGARFVHAYYTQNTLKVLPMLLYLAGS